jgi:CheY-like chemotaxis protein
VLIVDDNRVNRRVIHQHICSWGMRNGSYASAEEALAAVLEARAAGDPYHIVIADYHMPGIDGVMLAQQLRELPEKLVYVLLTSVGHWKEHASLPDGLIDACLTKPVRHRKLMDTLAAAVARQQAGGAAAAPAPRLPPRADRSRRGGLTRAGPASWWSRTIRSTRRSRCTSSRRCTSRPTSSAAARKRWRCSSSPTTTWC